MKHIQIMPKVHNQITSVHSTRIITLKMIQHIYSCTHVYIQMYTCIHTAVHMYTYSCIHIYIQLYTYIQQSLLPYPQQICNCRMAGRPKRGFVPLYQNKHYFNFSMISKCVVLNASSKACAIRNGLPY